MKNDDQARFLFGISLTDKPKWQQFLICSSGFFFGYLVNGLCEVCFMLFLFFFPVSINTLLFCIYSTLSVSICLYDMT